MQRLFKLFFISLILSAQGCQSLSEYMVYPAMLEEPFDQEQVYELFLEGMRYQELNKQQQQAACKKLKKDFEIKPQWQIAWLLVYALNTNFSCISLNKTLVLMNKIQQTQGVNSQLLWLNKNQIQLLKKFHKKNNSLQNQLNDTEVQLQQVISKIQALKAIETNINKKLDNE